jgi:hypothetical protein
VCEEWFLAERHTYTNEVKRTWLPIPAAPDSAKETA